MKRMMLIDDHADEARELAASLRSRGWEVMVLHSAHAAFDAVRAQQPDVIVTELVLPDAHGLHVARALRSLAMRDLVVVALTRLADQLAERALAYGFDHVVRKPAHVDALTARLDDLVFRSRLTA
jgi:DNA-binding response OmpR family regulator